MARPRPPEQPDRYPPCARCGGCYQQGARWPEGTVCQYCYANGTRRRGRCARCGHEGILPGLDDQGQPTCRACSGIQINVDCLRCGAEDTLYRADTCMRCALGDDLRALLADADGRLNPVFTPFIDLVTSMPRPASGMAWIQVSRSSHGGTVPHLLQQLGTGQLPLTHEAFDESPANARSVNHLRGLLVKAGLLPPRDELLARYSTWLARKLATIEDDLQRRIIEQYGRWHHLRRLRRHAEIGPVTLGQLLAAKQHTTVASEFLTWLAGRERVLADCTQTDVDAWFAGGSSTRRHADTFLHWARHHRLVPRLDIPNLKQPLRVSPFSRGQRLACLRDLLISDTAPLGYRVAGGILLLFGLGVTRIAALQLDQVRTVIDPRDGQVTHLRIAEDWLPVPEPLAALLRTYLAARPNTNTANHDVTWLFPGITPGQHVNANVINRALARHGIPPLAGRTGTWQQLFREGPPQVLAKALGISPTTALRHAALAGSDWTAYAADRAQQQSRTNS